MISQQGSFLCARGRGCGCRSYRRCRHSRSDGGSGSGGGNSGGSRGRDKRGRGRGSGLPCGGGGHDHPVLEPLLNLCNEVRRARGGQACTDTATSPNREAQTQPHTHTGHAPRRLTTSPAHTGLARYAFTRALSAFSAATSACRSLMVIWRNGGITLSHSARPPQRSPHAHLLVHDTHGEETGQRAQAEVEEGLAVRVVECADVLPLGGGRRRGGERRRQR